MDCFGTTKESLDYHPLNYQHLKIAQEKDKTILRILKMKNTICSQGFPWGRKNYLLDMFKKITLSF
jgi:hypothetical protein